MYIVYDLALKLMATIIWPLIFILFIIKPKLRAGFFQKIGFYKKLCTKKPVIWIHAVSVGEVNAIENLTKKIAKELPEYDIVLTTVTRTGQEIANKKLSNIAHCITYFPYEFTFSIQAAIKAFNPKLVIIAETEIWPNFSNQINNKNIPLIIVNGRISPNSYNGYKKAKFFFKNILQKYTLLLMQTEADKKRMINIGADEKNVEVMGNLKFDITPALSKKQINNLKESLKISSEKVLIAGSTHKGEDEIVLNVYKELINEFPSLKLILAPRHPERLNSVINLIEAYNLKFGRKSLADTFEDNQIILVDTMGELQNLYSISDIAFIGGGFFQTGGHNPLEPAIYNVPVISGSGIFNFKDIYKFMVTHNSAIIVNNQTELKDSIKKLLTNTKIHNEISLNCKKIFDDNKGALDYSTNKIIELLKPNLKK